MSLLALVLSILFCTSIAPNPVDKKTGDDTPAIQGCSGRSPISLVEVTKTIKEYSNLFYYKEGKNIALKYYPDYGLQFVGYGYANNFEGTSRICEGHVSLESCLQFARQVRSEQGDAYNFMWYQYNTGYCCSAKNGTGHTNNNLFLHYRFTW